MEKLEGKQFMLMIFADACIYFMNKKTNKFLINIGVGKDYTIIEFAKKILKVVQVKAKLKFDKTKPNGTPQKLLDVTEAKKYGWKSKKSRRWFVKSVQIFYKLLVKFSIITVVKNNKFQISKTINSIQNQNFKNFEFIIVDGVSKDGTTEEIKTKSKSFKKLKHIIRKDKNLYDGLNYGIKISSGKYIVILHSGDIFF